MIHCKDCVHWDRENADPSDGTAKCPRLYPDSSKPQLIMMVGYDLDEVWTAPEFGCVLGEARPGSASDEDNSASWIAPHD